MRVVQEERRLSPRARRLPRNLGAVVVVTRELSDTGGLPLAAGPGLGPVPSVAVALADVQATLARLLVEQGCGEIS
jgi:hypothetical protein